MRTTVVEAWLMTHNIAKKFKADASWRSQPRTYDLFGVAAFVQLNV